LIDLAPAARHALDPHLPRLRFLLDDIAVLDIPTRMQRTLTPAAKIMLTLHKIAPGNTRLGVELMPLVEDLRALPADPGGLDDLQAVVTYIPIVGDTTQADLGLVIDRLGPDAREAIMTTAERLRAEGRLEGEARGRTELLTEFLTAKFRAGARACRRGYRGRRCRGYVGVAAPHFHRGQSRRGVRAVAPDSVYGIVPGLLRPG
jgi:hypothetical protein